MKKYFLLLIFLVFAFLSRCQMFLPIEENHLMNGNTPTNNTVCKTYSRDAIQKAFIYLIDTLKFEYRYIYGACENRAQLMSAALQKKGLDNKKIWCFSPLRYSFISQKQLWVPDPLKIKPVISWTYHVAPVVFTDNGDTLVVDPSLSSGGPVKYTRWLEALHCPQAIYNFSDPNWYLFYSLNGFMVFNNFNDDPVKNFTLPTWFPNVITGDFFEYSEASQNVSAGMAVNDIAMQIYTNEKQNIDTSDFVKILGNINNIISFITESTNNIITADFKNKYGAMATRYAAAFIVRKTYWNNVYKTLKN